MAAVRVLPDQLVNQIAAGEVVERPASVVKELVENALDAGATRVTIDIEGGGVARIEVTDDGCGMDEQDARLALERHATSKISSAEDLTRIETLGFRGEALPSIASVARLTLKTSPDASGLGTQVRLGRAEASAVRPMSQPKGTRVLVEELFANVPARRKFLKSAEAELRAIVKTVTALALARPGIGFVLRSGRRTLIDLAPAHDVGTRFLELLGEAAGRPIPVSFSLRGMTLTGVVTPPDRTFPSRVSQWFFLNGRSIKDATVSHAATLAAREALRSDRHPAFALFLACEPSLADVNVHPQKLEVRFRDPNAVHSLVHRGLLAALEGGKTATAVGAEAFSEDSHLRLVRAGPFGGEHRTGSTDVAAIAEAVGIYGGPLVAAETAGVARAAYPEAAEVSSPLGPLRLLGQYRESFLLAEGEKGLVLIDQHVAHERVRYERILGRLEGSPTPSQRLLLPVTFEATPDEALLLARTDGLLASSGFTISELSGRTFVVSAAPADTPAGAIAPFLCEFLARIGELPEGSEEGMRAKQALAASLACRGAITVNTPVSPAAAERLLRDLALCRDPFTCPHGRPILLTFEHVELERRFGRR